MITRRRGLILVGLAVAGLAVFARAKQDDAPRRPPTTPGQTVACCGVALRLPHEWVGHISNGALSGGLPWIEAAKTGEIELGLAEVGNPPGVGRFRTTNLPVGIASAHEVTRQPGDRRGWTRFARRFATNGRSFSLLVAVRNERSVPATAEVNRVLKTLRIRRLPGTDAATLVRLRRPLHLPDASRSSRCPRSAAGRAAPKTGVTLGTGPAYPVLGSADGVARLRDDVRKRGWYFHKTLWAVSPRYSGPLLLRGGRIDRSGPLRFHVGGPLRAALTWPSMTGGTDWRYGPSTTALRGPGCYAFQIDGNDFSRVVVFEARI